MKTHIDKLKHLLFTKTTYKPKKYSFATEFRDKQLLVAWVPSHITYNDDLAAYANLPTKYKDILIRTLGFFTQADVNIQKNQVFSLSDLFEWQGELSGMLSAFNAIEGVHADAYSSFIDKVIAPEEDFYEAYKNITIFRNLDNAAAAAKYNYKNIDNNEQMVLYLLETFVFIEGVYLFTFFALLQFYRKFAFTGLDTLVRYSLRDETYHVQALCHVIRLIKIDVNNLEFLSRLSEILEKTIRETTAIINYVIDDNEENLEDDLKTLMNNAKKYVCYNIKTILTNCFGNSFIEKLKDYIDITQFDTENPFPEYETLLCDQKIDAHIERSTLYTNFKFEQIEEDRTWK